MRRKPYVAYACMLAALMLVGCRKPAAESEAVRPVRAIKVGDLKAIQGREFPGRAKAKDEVELSFRVSGPLVSLPVDVGSKVKKGDVIAAIDPRDFQVALDSAQGNLAVRRRISWQWSAEPGRRRSSNSRPPWRRRRRPIGRLWRNMSGMPSCCRQRRSASRTST